MFIFGLAFVFKYQLWTNFTHCYCVSIVDFEQVSACWVIYMMQFFWLPTCHSLLECLALLIFSVISMYIHLPITTFYFRHNFLHIILTLFRPDLGRREKNNLDFYFQTFYGASKGFMKTLKAFTKPFETPQRRVKIKIYVNFYSNATFWNAGSEKG